MRRALATKARLDGTRRGAAMPYAAAVGAAAGSWLLLPVPLPAALAVAGLCLWRPSPVLVLAALALLTSTLGTRALAGLEDPPTGDLDAWVTLLDDPRPSAAGGIRVTVRHDGRRLEARAFGGAAGRLDDLLAGERASVTGTMRPASGAWNRWRHVAATLTVHEVGDAAPASPLYGFANRVRRLLASGAASLSHDHRALFSGMVFGDDRHQSARLADDFRAAGLGHLLVVSGQNVAFVLALAAPAAWRLRPGVRLVMLLSVLGVFAVLTRFEPSVLRAVTMAAVAVGSAALGRPEAGRRTLAWAVAAVLVLDPFLVRSLAFQLSVSATAGLMWIAPPLSEAMPGPRPLRLAVATTAGAQLAVTPLLVAVFGSVPLASLPANVLAGPASAPVMMWGLTGGLAAGAAGGWTAWLVHRPTALLLWWIRGVAAAAAAAPPAVLGAGGAAVVGAGVAALLAARALRRRSSSVAPEAHAVAAGGVAAHAVAAAGVAAHAVAAAGVAAPGVAAGGVGEPGVEAVGAGVRRAAPPDRGRVVSGRSKGLRLVGMLGAAAVAFAFAHSLLDTASPPAGWSETAGVRVFSDGAALVLVLDRPGAPERLLESLREAGVRRVGLVVASRGGAADARAVMALADRFGDIAVVAPPMHRVPGARTVRRGWAVRAGSAVVEVVDDDPALEVRIEAPRPPVPPPTPGPGAAAADAPTGPRAASSPARASAVYSPAMGLPSDAAVRDGDQAAAQASAAAAGSGP